MHTVHTYTYKRMKPLLKNCNNINHVALSVLKQEIGACAIHFWHENIKNQLSGCGKNNW